MDKDILREYLVSEFKGDFPQIPNDPRVDMGSLTAGDDKPFFVTLPVARVGETSANGLVYDEELVRAIETQVIGRGGIMGHLKPEERATAFPVEDVDWVGVQRVGDTTWAKGYIPPGNARQFVHRLIARGGKLATSIYGPMEREPLKDGRWRARNFRLEQLDLAPPDRAALKLGGAVGVTAEIEQPEQEADMPTKEEILAELTVKELPAPLRETIIAEYQAQARTGERIAELEQSVSDRDTVIAEMRTQIDKQKSREFDAALTGIVSEFVTLEASDEEGKKRVDALRRMFRGQLVAELGDERDPAKAQAAAKRIWEQEFQVIAETVRDALAGPSAVVSGKIRGRRELDDTPSARAQARSQFAF